MSDLCLFQREEGREEGREGVTDCFAVTRADNLGGVHMSSAGRSEALLE